MDKIIISIVMMFIITWVISAVMRRIQGAVAPPQPNRPPRPAVNEPPVQRTTNNDIDRFMAEIDRLRQRGEGNPANPRPAGGETRAAAPGRPGTPPPLPANQQQPQQRPRGTTGERRRTQVRPNTPMAPQTPGRVAEMQVLTPVETAPSSAMSAPAAPLAPVAPSNILKPAKKAAMVGDVVAVSPLLKTLQNLMKSSNGPKVAVVLAEIFGPPKSAQARPQMVPRAPIADSSPKDSA